MSDVNVALYEAGVRHGIALARSGHWAAQYSTPSDICAGCGHAKNSHLKDDGGWCTLPEGTCIFSPCACTAFVPPTNDLITSAVYRVLSGMEAPT